MRIRIPKENGDLRRYVLRRRCLQMFGYLLWTAALVYGAIAYNAAHATYPPHRLILGWKLAVWIAAVLVSGFFLFRVPGMIKGRGFVGTIKRSSLAHSYTHSADPGAADPVDYDFRLHTSLVVQTEQGKRRRVRFEQKPGFYLYYYEGTRICKLSGLPYPLRDPASVTSTEDGNRKTHGDDLSGGHLCVACGRLNRHLEQPCTGCGLSLIDPCVLFEKKQDDGTEDI